MSQARSMIQVRGLDCPNEVEVLRAALRDQKGITGLAFDLINSVMTVDHLPDVVDPARLARLVTERTGMQASLQGEVEPSKASGTAAESVSWWLRYGEWLLTIGSGLALGVGMAFSWFGPAMGLSAAIAGRLAIAGYAAAIAIGGIGLFPRAARNLLRLRLDIEVLMGLAVLGAVALGQWDEAATVAFLYGLSEALESLSLERARRSIRALLDLSPPSAERIGADGVVEVVPANQVRAGDRVLVRAGDTIPVDGEIAAGRSNVDQKTITGESVPVEHGPGDTVYAGTVNGEGTLEIRAAGPVSDALISRVVAQVRASQAGKAPIERRISQFAAVYTPMVVGLSLLVMFTPPIVAAIGGHAWDWTLFREWFGRGLVVLVIACPCALVIATPVAVVSGLAAAARAGILIRAGEFLEEIGRLRALAFDKTGTLTQGLPDVVEVVCAPGHADEDRVVRIAAALGDRGGHVLGKAIARYARRRSLDVPMADDYRAVPGRGARGRVDAVDYHMGSHRYIDEQGLCAPEFHDQLGRAEDAVGTSVALTGDTGPMGWIRLADRPRPEAARVLSELHDLGLRTIMLTGDNAETAEAVARELGVGEQRAGLLPADKVSAIAELDAQHGPTGMVGDGVNDAPALAAAKVSIALGGISSGAALETADIVLLADDLGRLPWLIRHSRATLAMIRQNIVLALLTKAIVLLLAVFGLANLWMAIAADVGTSLVVIANSLRLLRRFPGEGPSQGSDPAGGPSRRTPRARFTVRLMMVVVAVIALGLAIAEEFRDGNPPRIVVRGIPQRIARLRPGMSREQARAILGLDQTWLTGGTDARFAHGEGNAFNQHEVYFIRSPQNCRQRIHAARLHRALLGRSHG
jgi:Zn2+/Cd2+-exporting ATPase